MFMLRTIVDPKVTYLGISIFISITSLTQATASESMAIFIETFKLDPITTPEEFGKLLTYMTVSTMAISLPFFYISGRCIVAKSKRDQQLKLSTEDKIKLSKKASAFIWSNAGGDIIMNDESKKTTFKDMQYIKQKITY